MSYQVTVLRRAQYDVDSIIHWIAFERESPQGAAAWLNEYELAVSRLANNPLVYPLAPESGAVDFVLRQFLIKTKRGRTYRGVFTVVNDEIRVLRVRGPGQPPLGPDEITD